MVPNYKVDFYSFSTFPLWRQGISVYPYFYLLIPTKAWSLTVQALKAYFRRNICANVHMSESQLRHKHRQKILHLQKET